MRLLPLATLSALAAMAVWPGLAAGQTASDFTDWTSAAGNAASGTLHGRSVSLTPAAGTVSPPPASVVDGSSTVFARPELTPPLAHSDAIHFVGASGFGYELEFATPVKDPVLHFGSLASTIDFAPGTPVTRLSGDGQFATSGSSVVGSLEAPSDDGNGSVRLSGTFTSIPFTTTFAGSDGIFLQVGEKAAAPPPPPPPPSGGGGGSAPPPPPRITALRRVTLPGRDRPAVVTAGVSGSYARLRGP